MAQKLFICEGEIGEDLLQRQPLAGCIADGYTVTSVSGYSTRDNRQMCVVLMAEPETQDEDNTGNDTEVQGDNTEQGYNTEQGGGSEPQENP